MREFQKAKDDMMTEINKPPTTPSEGGAKKADVEVTAVEVDSTHTPPESPKHS
jgi:hypothetical protein